MTTREAYQRGYDNGFAAAENRAVGVNDKSADKKAMNCYDTYYYCGKCDSPLNGSERWCPQCGYKINWGGKQPGFVL